MKYRYVLNSSLGELIVNDSPKGWDSKRFILSESETYTGNMIAVSADLEFINFPTKDFTEVGVYDYLVTLDELEDSEAKCSIRIESLSNNIDGWVLEFDGFLDFNEKNDNARGGKSISFPIYSDNFSNKILEREDIIIPYDRLETLDNNPIIPFNEEYKTVDVLGVDVVGDNVNTLFEEYKYTQSGNNQRNVVFSLDTNARSQNFNNIGIRQYGGSFLPKLMTPVDCYFLAKASAKLSFEFDITYDFSSDLGTSPNYWSCNVILYKLIFDDDFNLIDQVILQENTHDNEAFNVEFNGTHNIQLEKNEGIAFYGYHYAQNAFTNVGSYIQMQENNTIITSYSELDYPTECQFVPPIELFTRLTESITGEANAVYSTFFGRTDSPTTYDEDGKGSLLFASNGKLNRGFPAGHVSTDENKVAQLGFSFKEAFQNYEKIYNIGAGVVYDEDESRYKLIIEDKKYFFSNEIILTIERGQLEDESFSIKRDQSIYYSKVKTGCTFSQPEEVSGLEEYNNIENYSGVLVNSNELDLVGSYIYAVYPWEFSRRLRFNGTETQDYKYDNSVMLMQMYRESGFIQKTDQGYDKIEGIDLISTQMNLDLTPQRNFRDNWAWWFKTGYKKQNNTILKYNTSENTTDLLTKRTVEAYDVLENSDIPVNELETPILSGDIHSFNAPLPSETFRLLKAGQNGIIKYWNPQREKYSFGKYKQVSTEPATCATNYEIREYYNVSDTDDGFRLLEDGGIRLLEDGGKRLLE